MGFPAFPASQLFHLPSHNCIAQQLRTWWQNDVKMMQNGLNSIALPPVFTQRTCWTHCPVAFLPGKAGRSRDCTPLWAFPWLSTPSCAWEGLALLWQGAPWAHSSQQIPTASGSGIPTRITRGHTHTDYSFSLWGFPAIHSTCFH